MKHKGYAALLLVLLLILLIPVTASADVIYPAPDAFTVGVEVNHLLASLDPGGIVWTDPELLPEGLYLETEETEEGVDVYLRGVPAAAGYYELLFRYNDVESICAVSIVEAIPIAVAVSSPPQVTEYVAGDVLDPEGLVLEVAYSNGACVEVTEGFSLYPTRLETAGTRSIEVNYEGLLCFFNVEVAPAPEEIEGIGVLRLPEKVIYQVGEELDASGLMIRVYTNNGTRDVYEELLCFPTQLNEPGLQEITVYYADQMCVFTVQVLAEETEKSLAVYHLPYKLDYQVGEDLDPSGLVLIETDGELETRLVEGEFTCEPTHFSEPGRQEITVRLDELDCSFYVTVLAPSAPEPGAEPAEKPVLPAAPTAAVIEPVPETLPPKVGPTVEQNGPGLVTVIVAAAMGALLILGVYVFVVNRSGREYFAESVKDLFRRKK